MISQAAVEAAPQALPPLPPLPPATPQAPVIAPATPVANVPRSVLQARAGELSRQLQSVSGRREELLEQLRQTTSDVARTGIESRISLLDQRILEIEGAIRENGRALVQSAGAGTIEPARSRGNDGPPPEVVGVGVFLLLLPVAIAMARRIWRGGSRTHVPQRDPENEARLERIEQAVDAIAIEVERISEGQRFQNKLLGEGQGVPAFGFARAREGERVGG